MALGCHSDLACGLCGHCELRFLLDQEAVGQQAAALGTLLGLMEYLACHQMQRDARVCWCAHSDFLPSLARCSSGVFQ
jgi:hypothetical protein